MKNQGSKGYTKMPNDILLDTDLTMQARFLYALLKYHARDKGECFPGVALLAELMCLKRRMVTTYMNELVAAGLVERVRMGKRRPNLYRLVMSNTLHITGRSADAVMGNTLHEVMRNTLPPKKKHEKKKRALEDVRVEAGKDQETETRQTPERVRSSLTTVDFDKLKLVELVQESPAPLFTFTPASLPAASLLAVDDEDAHEELFLGSDEPIPF